MKSRDEDLDGVSEGVLSKLRQTFSKRMRAYCTVAVEKGRVVRNEIRAQLFARMFRVLREAQPTGQVSAQQERRRKIG